KWALRSVTEVAIEVFARPERDRVEQRTSPPHFTLCVTSAAHRSRGVVGEADDECRRRRQNREGDQHLEEGRTGVRTVARMETVHALLAIHGDGIASLPR